jgi:hypothetical protein
LLVVAAQPPVFSPALNTIVVADGMSFKFDDKNEMNFFQGITM